MGDRRCCCLKCFIASDDFNRSDSGDPGDYWVEIVPGEWSITSNFLHCDVTGPLITRHRQQGSARPSGIEHSYRMSVKLADFPESGEKQWAIICRYVTSTKFDWIGLTYNATSGQLLPAFYSRDGTDTLLMDITTHPAGEYWSIPPGTSRFHIQICYGKSEWTITPTGDDTIQADVYWARIGTNVNLPEEYGVVGFLYGDFDDWYFERHWEVKTDCDFCQCFCRHPDDEDDYQGLEESLTATIIADFSYVCSELDDLTLTMHQSFPGISSHDAAPVKKLWFSDIFNVESAQAWLVMECNNGEFRMACLAYPNTDLDGGQLTGLAFGVSSGSPSVANWDTNNSTCNPLSLRFNNLWAGSQTCNLTDPPRTGIRPLPCVSGVCADTDDYESISWHVIVTL